MYKFPDLAFLLVEYKIHEARLGLLQYLWQYFQEQKAVEVLIFFDGRKSPWEDCYSEKYAEMSVHYSQEKKADELIMACLTQSPIPSQCLVITSDKEIINFARRIRAKRKTSEEFYKEWTSHWDLQMESEVDQIKEGVKEQTETEFWMKQFLR